MHTKTCSTCNEEKKVTEFYKRKSSKDGRRGQCIVCVRRRNRERYNSDPDVRERHSKNMRNYRRRKLRDPEYIKEERRKHREQRLDPEYKKRERERDRIYARKRREDPEYRKYMSGYLQEWHKKNPKKSTEYWQKRRALMERAEYEEFTYDEVFIRDDGRCHICGKKVDPDNWHLDHLIPVAQGGGHTRKNVAVSHPLCNNKKYSTGPAQLRLTGNLTDEY